MATKWKKCKIIISIAAFCLGWCMLLSGLLSVICIWDQSSLGTEGFSLLAEDDYQETDSFRSFISGRLENYLSMAVGGPVSRSVWYSDSTVTYTDSMYSHGYAAEETTYVYDETESYLEEQTAAAAEEGTSSEGETYAPGDVYRYGGQPADTPDQAAYYRQQAEQFHQDSREDKNLLYIIRYEGETVYTNAEGTGLEGGDTPSLPEGYNFLLTFDGEKVRIVKDGQDVDVYGDGYYREDSQWYVPGYQNFTTDENSTKASVVIAAAQSPILYMKGDYASNGYAESYSPLYWMAQDISALRQTLLGWLGCAGAGLALILLSLAMKEARAEGWRRLSAVTGRVWFEVKLLLLCLAFVLLAVFRAGTWYYYPTIYLAALSLVFFLAALAASDLKYNQRPWRRSLTARLYRLFQTSQLRLSAQKQSLRRHALLLVLELLMAIVMIIFLFILADQYYVDDLIPLYLAALLLLALIAAITVRSAVRSKTTAVSLDQLTGQIAAIRAGDLEHPIHLPEDSPLAAASSDLNDIQQGLHTALEEQMKSERMKVELVSNVSHDIKTPLTSIISYVDLLTREKDLPDYIQDYIRILDSKSQRLKAMVQDVFEISKAASGQLPVEMEDIDLGKLLRQTLADMAEAIDSSSVTVKTTIPETPVMIRADGQRLYRVFQNLIQNALQYSLEGSRVYLSLTAKDQTAAAVVKNTSRFELPADIDFAERFTRGDNSRTDGGSGLGLSIAKSFTEACGGAFQIQTDADLFTVTVMFRMKE